MADSVQQDRTTQVIMEPSGVEEEVDGVEEAFLVEEVSIDGMCGVY